MAVALMGLVGAARAADSEIAFGPVTLGSVGLTRQATLANSGSTPMTLLSISPGDNDFRPGLPASTNASPGGVITFPVTFAPTVAGQRQTRIVIRVQSGAGISRRFLRLTGTGVLDTSPGAVDPLDLDIIGPGVTAVAVQPDGKILLGGSFTSVRGEPRTNIARLNANGTLDRRFKPSVLGAVLCLAVQPDGQIVVGGDFTRVWTGGRPVTVPRHRLARLRTDGSLDPEFNPSANGPVRCLVVQSDGKILAGGSFTELRPSDPAAPRDQPWPSRSRLARLNSDGAIDRTFLVRPNGAVNSMAVQTDGRIIIGGEFTSIFLPGESVNAERRRVARLNPEGTLDPAFRPSVNGPVLCLALQADGRVLLGGRFTHLRSPAVTRPFHRPWLARLTAGGNLDLSFDPRPNEQVRSIAVQADGQIILGGDFTELRAMGATAAASRHRVARIHPDGTLDVGFDPKANGQVFSVALQSDGGILLGGTFSRLQPNGAATHTLRHRFARLHNGPAPQPLTAYVASQIVWERAGSAPEVTAAHFDVSTNSGVTWRPLGPATRVGTTARWEKVGLDLPPRGKLRARGRTQGGGFNGSGGWIETLGILGPAEIIVEQPSGLPLADGTATVEFGTAFARGHGVTHTVTVRNAGGLPLSNLAASLDGTSAADFLLGPLGSTQLPPGAITTFTVAFVPITPGVKTAGLHIHSNLPGNANPFDLVLAGEALLDTRPGAVDDLDVLAGYPDPWGSTVNAAVEQADGRILLGGLFTSILGIPRSCLARVNPDGSLDASFDPNPNGEVRHVMVEPDGRILISGTFTSLQPDGSPTPIPRRYLARLNADGTLDSSFDPPSLDSPITCMAQQPDGKTLLGGQLVRLNANGTLDTGFTARVDGLVNCMAIQPDGKIIVVGDFQTVVESGSEVPTERRHMARLHGDGTLDMAFEPRPTRSVNLVLLQPDGTIQVTGQFSGFLSGPDEFFQQAFDHACLTPDGRLIWSIDSFEGLYTARSLVFQAGESIILSESDNPLRRFGYRGGLDSTFTPRVSDVASLSLARDGKVLVGGRFANALGSDAALSTPRLAFARLYNGPATNNLTIPDRSRIVWIRGGTAPDISQVTFELSPDDGTTWAPLGAGNRVGSSPDWQLTGLTLPANGMIRARGRSIGGLANSSLGMVETVAAFTGIAPP